MGLFDVKGSKFIFFFLLTLVLLSVCVIAPKTTPVELSSNGYIIEYPKFDNLKQNEDMKFNFHVFNSSNGVPILNKSTSCYFHLYNISGNHVYRNQTIIYVDDLFDFEVLVKGSNFSKVGRYSYVFQCNDSGNGLGGFASVPLDVTSRGMISISDTELVDQQGNTAVALPVTIFILLITLSLFGLSFMKFTDNEISNLVIKRGLWTIGFFLLSFDSAIIATLVSSSNIPLTHELFMFLWLFGYGGYIMLFLTVLLTIFDVVKLYKISKGNKRMGN